MKKIALILSACIAFVSCDKISNPVVPKNTVAGSSFVKKSNSDVSNSKKTLLEEYTGQRCVFCPTGARTIKNDLLPAYPNNLIVIAVHQGNTFAQPFGKFKNDFRTSAGEAWGDKDNFGIDSWPTGMFNRKDYNSEGLKLPYSKWTSIAPTSFNDPFIIKLDLNTEYDTTVRALNLYVKGTFKMPYSNPVKLSALYLQDGIIGPQEDGSVTIEDYEFEHMLRGDINGTWGVDFTTAAAAAQDSAKWSTIGFPLPAVGGFNSNGKGLDINDKNVTVVVFAYDAVTKAVLQAEKLKIR